MPNGDNNDVLQAGHCLNASLGFRTLGAVVSITGSILISNTLTPFSGNTAGRGPRTSSRQTQVRHHAGTHVRTTYIVRVPCHTMRRVEKAEITVFREFR